MSSLIWWSDEDAGTVAACVCVCVWGGGVYVGLLMKCFCLPAADEDLSGKRRLCLLLSLTNTH